jgi:hypothetical protein
VGYAVDAGQVPDDEQAVRVGGPLSSLRSCLSRSSWLAPVPESTESAAPTVGAYRQLGDVGHFREMGDSKFIPLPKDVRHFNVLFPLLCALRQWQYHALLVKVKSHTWCRMNEKADELAERGYCEDSPEVCSARRNMDLFS